MSRDHREKFFAPVVEFLVCSLFCCLLNTFRYTCLRERVMAANLSVIPSCNFAQNSSSDSSVINAEEITAAQLVNTKGSMYKAYAVNCISMRQIMRNEGVKHVHLWSLGKKSK